VLASSVLAENADQVSFRDVTIAFTDVLDIPKAGTAPYQAMTLTDANLFGAQKLANAVSKTSNKITFLNKVPLLGVVAKVTGVATVLVDAREAEIQWKQGNKVKSILKGAEAAGTLVVTPFGGEEIELAWNLGTMGADYLMKLF